MCQYHRFPLATQLEMTWVGAEMPVQYACLRSLQTPCLCVCVQSISACVCVRECTCALRVCAFARLRLRECLRCLVNCTGVIHAKRTEAPLMESKKSSLLTHLNSPGGEIHGPGAAKAQPSKIIMVIMTMHVEDHRGALLNISALWLFSLVDCIVDASYRYSSLITDSASSQAAASS